MESYNVSMLMELKFTNLKTLHRSDCLVIQENRPCALIKKQIKYKCLSERVFKSEIMQKKKRIGKIRADKNIKLILNKNHLFQFFT